MKSGYERCIQSPTHLMHTVCAQYASLYVCMSVVAHTVLSLRPYTRREVGPEWLHTDTGRTGGGFFSRLPLPEVAL